MKALLLGVFLSVMQTAPPVPRQAIENHTDKASAKTKVAQHNEQPTTPLSPDTPVKVSTGENTTAESSTSKTQNAIPSTPKNNSSWNKSDVLTLIYVILTGFLVVIGGFGVCFALRTLRAIERQVYEMAQQRVVMRRQTRHIARQAQSMRYQTTHLKNAVIQARRAAKAAKLSADMAVGVSIPTLVIEGFETGDVGAANLAAMIQYPKIKLTVRNYGQTPAILKWWTIIFTCESLPDVPVYEGYAGCGIVLDKIVVKPDTSGILPQISTWQRQEISLDDVQAVIHRTKTLTAYGYICYDDLFGNPLRRLKFCETAMNIWPHGAIQWVSGMGPHAYSGIDQLPLARKRSEDRADIEA